MNVACEWKQFRMSEVSLNILELKRNIALLHVLDFVFIWAAIYGVAESVTTEAT